MWHTYLSLMEQELIIEKHEPLSLQDKLNWLTLNRPNRPVISNYVKNNPEKLTVGIHCPASERKEAISRPQYPE